MSTTRTIPAPPPALVDALRAANVPLEEYQDACRACGDCDDDEEEEVEGYPKGFEVDQETMLGEVKAFGRQIVISTGKSDWAHEVTEEEGSVPGLVCAAYEDAQKKREGERPGMLGRLSSKLFGAGDAETAKEQQPKQEGWHPTPAATPGEGKTSTRLSILASSLLSSSPTHEGESVLVLPDFKVVHDVHPRRSDAEELVRRYLAPEVGGLGAGAPASEGEEGSEGLRSWPLPYHAVILLCSHKKRDKRCSISAPLLISQFHHHLSRHGLQVDERGDDLSDGPPIEEWPGTAEEKEQRLKEALQGASVAKADGEGARVGIFKTSHLGMHKWAANMMIYFPNGSVVWYARTTPADVKLIVDRTIMEGKVIPEFLRGGLGITGKDGAKGVLEW
ncbi:hypothetical protein JCM10213_007456 [Rhodosporidiobolus nylandii]